MRDRLVELIKHDNCISPATCSSKCKYVDLDDCHSERLADYLLENGVIVPPCKVGDKVYRVSTRSGTKLKYIQETTISRIAIDNEGIWLFCTCNPIAKCVFGKTIFLTREEAEAKLKEGAE